MAILLSMKLQTLKLYEGYRDVSTDFINSLPKYWEYKNEDDTMIKDGIVYLYFNDNDPDIGGTIKAFDQYDGTEVANSMFSSHQLPDDKIMATIDVRPDKTRRGIATNIYMWIEKLTGKTLIPDVPHSPSAAKFWGQPNRPFGR